MHWDPRREDWDGVDPRWDLTGSGTAGSGTSLMTSGFMDVDNQITHTLTWHQQVASGTATALSGIKMRLYCYDSSESACDPEYLEYHVPATFTGTWARVTKTIGPYKGPEVSGQNNWPSGTAKTKLEIFASGTTSAGVYVNGLDLSAGASFVGYSAVTSGTTWVTYSGLTTGAVDNINPLIRTDYEFLGQRLWKASDATKVPPDNYLSFVDDEALADTEYTYVIDAFDSNGNRSPLSSQATIMAGDATPPSQVTGLTAEGIPDGVMLSWVCPADSDYSHVNIYSDIGLSTLVKTELGKPFTNDLTIINGLTGGATYTYWVTAVDKYGNENTTAVPSGTATATTFESENNLATNVVGDQYVKAENVTFYVHARVEVSGTPGAWFIDAGGNQIDAQGITEVNPGYTYSGYFTVSGSTTNGWGTLFASGIGVDGTNAVSPGEAVLVDTVNPSIAVAASEYSCVNDSSNYVYKPQDPCVVSVTITDATSGPGMVGINYPTLWKYYENAESSNSYSVPLQGSDGTKTLTVRGYDKSGNYDSDSVTVYLDSYPPVVKLLDADQSNWQSSSSITLHFDADDDTSAVGGDTSKVAGFMYIKYRVKQNTSAWGSWATTTYAVTNPSINITSITGTPVHVEWQAFDKASNKTDVHYAEIQVDTTPPSIDTDVWRSGVCSPIPGGHYLAWGGGEITDDESGVSTVTLFRHSSDDDWDGDENDADVEEVITFPHSSGMMTYNDTYFSGYQYNKYYYWYLKATDRAGNKSDASVTYSGKIGHDLKGIFKNLINNGSFERTTSIDSYTPQGWVVTGNSVDDSSWASANYVTSDSQHGSSCVSVDSNSFVMIENFPFVNSFHDKRFIFSFYARYTGSSASATVKFDCYDAYDNVSTTTKTIPVTGSWARYSFTIGGVSPDVTIDSTYLRCDIRIASNSAVNAINIDAVQLEEAPDNNETEPTDYDDSWVITGDIIMGQRIIGSQIESDTISARNLIIGAVGGGNLIFNPSFEIADGDWVAGWSHTEDGSVTVTDVESYHESYSVLISGMSAVRELSTPVPTDANCIVIDDESATYCFSLYQKAAGSSNSGGLYVIADFYNNNNALITSEVVDTIVPENTSWIQRYCVLGPGGDVEIPTGTKKVRMVFRYYSYSAVDIYIDAVQFELGSTPSVFNLGGTTEIEGGQITTGRIQSNDVNHTTYFDLDIATMRTTSPNNSAIWSQLSAGQLKNHGEDGSYSILDNGKLIFHTPDGDDFDYAKQIQAIPASGLVCGSYNAFPYNYVKAPNVILVPATLQTYDAGGGSAQYVGLEATQISTSGFVPVARLYTESVLSTTSNPVTDQSAALHSTNGTTYLSSDAKDENPVAGTQMIGCTLSVLPALDDYDRFGTSYCHYTLRICSGSTWDGANVYNTSNGSIVVPPGWYTFDDVIFTTVVFAGPLPANQYCVKLDYWDCERTNPGDDPQTSTMYLGPVVYYTSTVTNLTGSGICSAIIIG